MLVEVILCIGGYIRKAIMIESGIRYGGFKHN